MLHPDSLRTARDVALRVWHIKGEPGELIELATLLARGHTAVAPTAVFDWLPIEAIVGARLWSPLACLASLSFDLGDDERALEYSGLIIDDLVDSGQNDPIEALHPDDPWGILNLEFNDVQIFGALSFIDLACGPIERALTRALRFDNGRDASGWRSAGHQVMAAWVLQSQTSESGRRFEILDAIARTSHATLGPLIARVALTKAEIHLQLGHRSEATEALAKARATVDISSVRLHLAQFAGYGALLKRVAVDPLELGRFAQELAQL